jgi:hypothetical protein
MEKDKGGGGAVEPTTRFGDHSEPRQARKVVERP